MDTAAPAAGKVGVHFLHHALKTVAPVDGGYVQVPVAVGSIAPNANDAGCTYDFTKWAAATFPEKAAAKAAKA